MGGYGVKQMVLAQVKTLVYDALIRHAVAADRRA
jgi:hypothetical protein